MEVANFKARDLRAAFNLGGTGRFALGSMGNTQRPLVKYPRVGYTDLDDLICKKSEEEVHSEGEGGERS